MIRLINFVTVWMLMVSAGFSAEVETTPYVLENICRFEPTQTADIASLIDEIDNRTSFSPIYFESLNSLLSLPSLEICVPEDVSVEAFENEVKRLIASHDIEDLRVLVDQTKNLCKQHMWIKYLKLSEAELTECKNREFLLEKGKTLLKSLFENPTICGYLAREDYKVDTEGNVIFSKMEEDIYYTIANIQETANIERFKDNSYYINYRCAETVPHGQNIEGYNQSKLFYESGSSSLINQKLVVNTARAKKEKLSNEPNMFYGPGGDIYDVAIKLKNIENQSKYYAFSDKTDYAYFIMPGAKDTHAYFTTAIVDVKTKKVLGVFLINSFVKEDYRDYLAKRLNLERSHDEHIPFINASLELQTEKEDGNCTLYTVNFAHAMIDLISDNRDALDQLAALSNLDDIADMIRSKLPAYLPQYYEKDQAGVYIKRPASEIKAYHMGMRWKLSLEDVKAIIARLREASTRN